MKDRAESVAVSFDFGPLAVGDVTAASVSTASDFGDGALVTDGPLVFGGVTVLQRIAAGTPGRVYSVEALATLADGQARTIEATIRVT